MTNLEKTAISLGYIPLTDCAPLVVAKEKGWFAAQGLDVTLSKETSWANIRDKVAIGVLDGAQMLAPMPLAASLGLGIRKPMVTALSLGLNGNAITVSAALYRRMAEAYPANPASALALAGVVAVDHAAGRPPLTFATVFPYSSHSYQLRYWLASGGIDPDRDVRLLVVPPPQMAASLARGQLDGFCVGEPWNGMAVANGSGRVVVTGYEVWNNAPEKVLGVTEEWAEQNPATHRSVVTALLQAAIWLDQPANRAEAAALLARSIYVNAPEAVLRAGLIGPFRCGPDDVRDLPDFHVFHRYAANFPWRSHAVWLLAQMVRWGQLPRSGDLHATAAAVYRPALYREVAGALGIAAPAGDLKGEGMHASGWTLGAIPMGADRLLDGDLFDPQDVDGYLAGLARREAGPHLARVK
jgi:ABC-type nitrate/sulfonate/bicarbonate transport system substrate-binding protein